MIRHSFTQVDAERDGNAARVRGDCRAAILAANPKQGGEDRRPTVAVGRAEESVFI